MVQCRDVRFVTNRQRNTFSVGDMLQCFKWPSLQDGQKDTWLVMMYKIANKNVLITNTNDLEPLLRKSRNMHSLSFIILPCKTQQRQKSFFPHMISDWNQLPLGWNIQNCCLFYEILIYETCIYVALTFFNCHVQLRT